MSRVSSSGRRSLARRSCVRAMPRAAGGEHHEWRTHSDATSESEHTMLNRHRIKAVAGRRRRADHRRPRRRRERRYGPVVGAGRLPGGRRPPPRAASRPAPRRPSPAGRPAPTRSRARSGPTRSGSLASSTSAPRARSARSARTARAAAPASSRPARTLGTLARPGRSVPGACSAPVTPADARRGASRRTDGGSRPSGQPARASPDTPRTRTDGHDYTHPLRDRHRGDASPVPLRSRAARRARPRRTSATPQPMRLRSGARTRARPGAHATTERRVGLALPHRPVDQPRNARLPPPKGPA